MTSPSARDRRWLDVAARIAAPFLGTTGALPTVGAILVDPATEAMLGRGVTAPGGQPSAEAIAIEDAGAAAAGATLYTTLEPSPGSDRLDAVLAAAIGRAVIGIADPNPARSGEGIARLRAAGIDVEITDQLSARQLHEGYISRTARGRPFVTAALAVSADGKVGRLGQGAIAIVGEAAQRWKQAQRSLAYAILVGWGTAKADDPELKVELEGLRERQPLRVLVAGLKTHGATMQLVTTAPDQPVLVVAIPEKKMTLPPGVEILQVKGKGRPEMAAALQGLGGRGVQSLFVETGPTLLESFLAAGLVDRFHLLLGETVIGEGGIAATARGTMEARLVAAGFSLVDHRLLGADNLRTFERIS